MTGNALAAAIGAALREADVTPDAIDHINAHGCGLPQSDICDTNAFKRTFGQRACQIPITSIKSMIGQPLAAARRVPLANLLPNTDGTRPVYDLVAPPVIRHLSEF
jgi:3-oxoacyl-(acyl-carrier-protein) synthase